MVAGSSKCGRARLEGNSTSDHGTTGLSCQDSRPAKTGPCFHPTRLLDASEPLFTCPRLSAVPRADCSVPGLAPRSPGGAMMRSLRLCTASWQRQGPVSRLPRWAYPSHCCRKSCSACTCAARCVAPPIVTCPTGTNCTSAGCRRRCPRVVRIRAAKPRDYFGYYSSDEAAELSQMMPSDPNSLFDDSESPLHCG